MISIMFAKSTRCISCFTILVFVSTFIHFVAASYADVAHRKESSQPQLSQEELFLIQFAMFFNGEDNVNEFYKKIIGKDIDSFRLNLDKTNNTKHVFLCDNKNENCGISSLPYESFRIVSIQTDQSHRELELVFKTSQITAETISEKLGTYDKMLSNYSPTFYDDCTFGYYNETRLIYRSNGLVIIFVFDTADNISNFYRYSNVKKYEDDPGYKKLEFFISTFDNIKTAKLKKIIIRAEGIGEDKKSQKSFPPKPV